MRNLIKYFTLLALLISLSLPVFGDTFNDTTNAKDEVKPSEVNDVIMPQQGRSSYCRYGCCGSYAFGTCSACCPRPQTMEAEAEANNTVTESHQRFANNIVIQPQQRFGNNTVSEPQQKSGNNTVIEPQQRFGNCKNGCGPAPQAAEARTKAEANISNTVIEPQQRPGHWSPNCDNGCRCRYYKSGRCICCSPGKDHELEAKP